jgi:hypothetical protein
MKFKNKVIKFKTIKTFETNSPKRFTCYAINAMPKKTFTVVCEKRLQNLTFTERTYKNWVKSI